MESFATVVSGFWFFCLMLSIQCCWKLKLTFDVTFEFVCCSSLHHWISVQIRSFFWSVFSRIRTKYGLEKTSYLDTFHAIHDSKHFQIFQQLNFEITAYGLIWRLNVDLLPVLPRRQCIFLTKNKDPHFPKYKELLLYHTKIISCLLTELLEIVTSANYPCNSYCLHDIINYGNGFF